MTTVRLRHSCDSNLCGTHLPWGIRSSWILGVELDDTNLHHLSLSSCFWWLRLMGLAAWCRSNEAWTMVSLVRHGNLERPTEFYADVSLPSNTSN
ncbi:hypothetical protein WN944_016914 [Citrus x changshan-huyou]|uniref:Uncharacterized protein n=1 Tax=Citrus x changshan-huyou TaxID=2935761 RepID=A0AAP0QKT2_9ROSI